MKLYYVTHPVLVMKTFAIMADDEAGLQKELDNRAEILKDVPFKAKLDRDKSGAVVGHTLGAGWPDGWVPGEDWVPTLK